MLSASLNYGFNRYVGFPIRMFLVGVNPETDSADFLVPIVVGNEIEDTSFRIGITGIDGDFTYEVDRERGLMKAKLSLPVDEEFVRLYGKLQVLGDDSKKLQEIPLILEHKDVVEIYPRSVRFASVDDESYEANVYVRLNVEPDGEVAFSATAVLNDLAFKCNTKRMGKSMFKIEIVVSQEQYDAMCSLKRADKLDDQIGLTVDFGDGSIRRSSPYTFRELLK